MITLHKKSIGNTANGISTCVLFHTSEITRSSWQLLVQKVLPEDRTCVASTIEEVQGHVATGNLCTVIMEFHPSSADQGIATLKSLVSLVGGESIVLVCGHPAHVSARTAMQVGVSVLIGSNESIDELKRAILAAQEHVPFMSSELASLFVRATPPSEEMQSRHGTSGYALSTREEEVMNMLLQGLRPAQVAERLGLSLKTVSSHKRNALGKLGVTNVLDAVRLWS